MAALDGAFALAEDLPRCRVGRPESEIRCGAGARRISPCRRRRWRKRLPLPIAPALNRLGNSSSLRTMRMPRPPPPAEALMMTGIADLAARIRALRPRWRECLRSRARMGTPAFFMAARAFSFSPIRRMTSGGGPMNLMLQVSADFGEIGVLAEQAVAGMDGVHVGDFRGADDGGNIEVAARSCGGPMQMASSAKRTWQASCGRLRSRRPPCGCPVPCRRR